MTLITRTPLRTDIRRHLVEQLILGEIEPGSQINESRLTDQLGVSRTPLREALLQLAFEGFVDAVPGKGFQVRPLTSRELRELFTVGVTLETLALRQSGGVSDDDVAELRELNERRAELLASGTDRDRLVELDDRWHRLLVSNCDNEQLLEFLRLVRNRMYRYLYAFEGQSEEVESAIDDHVAIQDALAKNDLDGAVEALRRHWNDSESILVDLVESDEM